MDEVLSYLLDWISKAARKCHKLGGLKVDSLPNEPPGKPFFKMVDNTSFFTDLLESLNKKTYIKP